MSEEGTPGKKIKHEHTESRRKDDSDRNFEEAKEKAAQIIVDAEQFHAKIAEPPKGRLLIDTGLSDDNFFHITCHVDTNLKAKIENGDFVELEKLLPKGKNKEGGMELVNRNGSTFFIPAESNNLKINGVRRWEQAFRVYAALYSAANPHRAAEIWQYIYVINTAAASYQWENVSMYDYTFRQLMAFNPGRSWARIYSQGWNLCMQDPVQKSGNTNFASHGRNFT